MKESITEDILEEQFWEEYNNNYSDQFINNQSHQNFMRQTQKRMLEKQSTSKHQNQNLNGSNQHSTLDHSKYESNDDVKLILHNDNRSKSKLRSSMTPLRIFYKSKFVQEDESFIRSKYLENSIDFKKSYKVKKEQIPDKKQLENILADRLNCLQCKKSLQKEEVYKNSSIDLKNITMCDNCSQNILRCISCFKHISILAEYNISGTTVMCEICKDKQKTVQKKTFNALENLKPKYLQIFIMYFGFELSQIVSKISLRFLKLFAKVLEEVYPHMIAILNYIKESQCWFNLLKFFQDLDYLVMLDLNPETQISSLTLLIDPKFYFTQVRQDGNFMNRHLRQQSDTLFKAESTKKELKLNYFKPFYDQIIINSDLVQMNLIGPIEFKILKMSWDNLLDKPNMSIQIYLQSNVKFTFGKSILKYKILSKPDDKATIIRLQFSKYSRLIFELNYKSGKQDEEFELVLRPNNCDRDDSTHTIIAAIKKNLENSRKVRDKLETKFLVNYFGVKIFQKIQKNSNLN